MFLWNKRSSVRQFHNKSPVIIKPLALILLLITITAPKAIGSSLDRSPWVDTRDAWLRADIESLASIANIVP